MTPPHTHIPRATEAEAGAWADVLVRYGLLHAALLAPDGRWLIHHPEAPVRVLNGPSAVIELAAHIQHRTRTLETRSR
ncbi:hypothetical protein AN219_37875 [Streptomyces nanshensis]|nr:hypothetical protein AN219_37875 [Streptomyces nanshensis]